MYRTTASLHELSLEPIIIVEALFFRCVTYGRSGYISDMPPTCSAIQYLPAATIYPVMAHGGLLMLLDTHSSKQPATRPAVGRCWC